MPDLQQCLETLPYHDLRGVITRLGLRERAAQHKQAWIDRIAQAWRDPARQSAFLATLSPAARRAAGRLAQAGELPAPLFLAEYGAVRRPQPGQYWAPPPWQAPQTISEELYYTGLLAPTPPALLEKAQRLALPTDLRHLFLGDAAPSQPAAAPDLTHANAATLLHDVAQALCLLAGHSEPALRHRRWLAPAAMADLNARLLHAERTPLPASHKRAPRLRFLFFLLAAAGLQTDGILTPLGWAWLAEPPPAQLTRLWNAWRAAPMALRQAYRQPTAALPEPWPDLALKHGANLPPAFTPAQLTQAVLGQEPALAPYFVAHLPDISALDAAAAGLLETLTTDWGACARVTEADTVAFTWTDLGRWLLDPGHVPPASLLAAAPPAPAARLDPQAADAWRLTVSPWAPPLPLAQLAPYSRAGGLIRAAPADAATGPDQDVAAPRHLYVLTEETVAAAAAAGHGLPALLEALTALDITLAPEQWRQLQAWHARGHEFVLEPLPLLRAARPELLAQAISHADVRAGLGELLSPTVALTALPPAELAARLRAAGFYPQEPGDRRQASGDKGEAPVDTANPQPVFRVTRSPAALWLAGQLYAALGEHLALPSPPPFTDLTTLFAALPPADQAAVQAQWEKLRSDLQALLDGRTFAPPPVPSDPTRWRPLIEAAIAAGRPLALRYFTAGRNVLTERTVTPYWIEEHRGIPYLRADCHLAGRVLLFRLDRIQALQESVDRSQ